MEEQPLANVEAHAHTGLDSPKVKLTDLLDSYDGSTAVKLTGDQTVAGIKTFTSIPVLPASDPTADNEATRKLYVDTRFAATEIYATDDLRDSADTERISSVSAYTKKKEIQINERGGTIRVKFDLKFTTHGSGTDDCKGKIYVNGIAVGTEHSGNEGTYTTFTDDITVVTGDLVQLYIGKIDTTIGDVSCRNFRLYYNKKFTITAGTIISN